MKTVDNESRLSRWSRRKQQSKAETKEEDQALDFQFSSNSEQLSEPIASPTAIKAVGEEQAAPETPVLTDSDMPAIETLNSESDFSMFMSSGVTDKLRNLALKQLFKAPHFNIRDGLDEYDEDYTFFEKLGDIVTCDMKHQIEVEALKKEAVKLESDKDATVDSVNADEPIDADEPIEDDLAGQDLEDDLEEDLEKGLSKDKPAGNSPDGIQKESKIETKDVSSSPENLAPRLTKIEILDGSILTNGEAS
jgi:hypothetical protein